MRPQQSHAEQMRHARELQGMFTKRSGAGMRTQSRPSSGAPRSVQGSTVSYARAPLRRLPMGARPKVHEPNINAVPGAEISQETKDWLNGGGPDKTKPPPAANKTQNDESQPAQENVVPQKTSQGAKTSVPLEKIKSTIAQDLKDHASREALSPPNIQSTHASQKSSVTTKDTMAALSSSDNDSDAKNEYRNDTNLQKKAPGTPAVPLAISTQLGLRKSRKLTILERYDRLKAEEEPREAEFPDLMDIDSPPSGLVTKFLDAEDLPASLPAPLLPSQNLQQKQTVLSNEEDLLQFEDLIASSPVETRGRNDFTKFTFGEAKAKLSGQPATSPITANGKANLTVSIEIDFTARFKSSARDSESTKKMKMKQGLPNSMWATPECQSQTLFPLTPTTEVMETAVGKARCTCKTNKPVKKVRGLTSSKWAEPGYQHQGQFLRNTEMFCHGAGCPVRVEWDRDHPLELGVNPVACDGADGGAMRAKPRQREPPNFVWQPKPKRLNPYALSFYPWGE